MEGGADRFVLRPVGGADGPALLAAFRRIVADGEGYPQHPDEPVTPTAFHDYWLAPATAAWVALDERGELAGAYTMKPNGVGRAAHVANAGYFVVREHRGQGLGRALVLHSFDEARRLGFDAMQFNFVFVDNPARALYEDLGFAVVGLVPDVIEGDPVVIYHRRL